MKKAMFVLGDSVIVLVLLVFVAFKVEKSMQDEIDYERIDMTVLRDGTYFGHYKTLFIDVEVSLVVLDGRLESIKLLKHENGKGQGAEIILQDMVDQNNFDVDCISGATSSSRVIKKAVEQALLKGKKEE
jgi:uncharacterized protein with FMN-binding domain